MADDVQRILGAEGRLARRIPDYEVRPQQLEMAQAVANALRRGEHLVAEAGTGTGKSFAYLVPSVLHATQPDKGHRRIVVSTHTISLQEQLIQNDLPLLNSVIPREFSSVLVKGRRNYLSLRRLKMAVSRSNSLFDRTGQVEELSWIRDWAKETSDGSLSDLSFRPSPAVWEEVASDSGNCLGQACETHKQCFYYAARRRVQHANILVVNHALFFTDLQLRQQKVNLLPEYDAVIFDEAHTLEAVASDHLGLRVTSGQVDYILRRLYNDQTNKGLLVHAKLKSLQRQVDHCRDAASDFFGSLYEWLHTQPMGSNLRIRQPDIVSNPLSNTLAKTSAMLAKHAKSIDKDSERRDFQSAADRTIALAEAIETWVKQVASDSVYWIETREDRHRMTQFTLAASPLDIGTLLRDRLFAETDTVVCTSATISTGRPASFDFFRSRVGLRRTGELRVGSPFDFRQQAKLVLVRGMPDPAKEAGAYERLCADMVKRYVTRTDGHAFVLFTSYDMLRRVEQRLAAWFRRQKMDLFSQASGMPRSQMVHLFKQQPRSVLFGTESFWQGVDVPGDALQNVIITKLPFSVPSHPLLEARLDAIRREGGNPFMEYQLPEAIIKLRQGFGRLIRTRRDRGMVVVLDPRIHTRRYGRQFIESLPDCSLVEDAVGNE